MPTSMRLLFQELVKIEQLTPSAFPTQLLLNSQELCVEECGNRHSILPMYQMDQWQLASKHQILLKTLCHCRAVSRKIHWLILLSAHQPLLKFSTPIQTWMRLLLQELVKMEQLTLSAFPTQLLLNSQEL